MTTPSSERRDEPGPLGQPDRDQDRGRHEARDHRVVDADRGVDEEVRPERDQPRRQQPLAQCRRAGARSGRRRPPRAPRPPRPAARIAVTGSMPAPISPAPSQDGSRPFLSISATKNWPRSPWTSRAKLANVVSSTYSGNRHSQREARGQVRGRQQAAGQHEPPPLARGVHCRRHTVST